MPVLRHVPQPIEQLLGLLQQVAELVHDLPLVLLHVLVHLPHTDTGVSKNDTTSTLHFDLDKISRYLLSQRIRYWYCHLFNTNLLSILNWNILGIKDRGWHYLFRVIWLFCSFCKLRFNIIQGLLIVTNLNIAECWAILISWLRVLAGCCDVSSWWGTNGPGAASRASDHCSIDMPIIWNNCC